MNKGPVLHEETLAKAAAGPEADIIADDRAERGAGNHKRDMQMAGRTRISGCGNQRRFSGQGETSAFKGRRPSKRCTMRDVIRRAGVVIDAQGAHEVCVIWRREQGRRTHGCQANTVRLSRGCNCILNQTSLALKTQMRELETRWRQS